MVNSRKDRSISINKIVSKLVERGDSAAIIRGFIGPAEEGVCRVYRSLDLTSYVEFPESAVIDAIEDSDSKDGRMRIIVGSSTQLEITNIHTTTVTASDLQITPWPPMGYGGPIIGGPYDWPYPIPGDEERGPAVWPPDRPSKPDCAGNCQDEYNRSVTNLGIALSAGYISVQEYFNALAHIRYERALCYNDCGVVSGSYIPKEGQAPRTHGARVRFW